MYLKIARECWDTIKNINHLVPTVYGMKVSYEKEIKRLNKIIKNLNEKNKDQII